MRRLLAFASTEITDCPRLFTLVREEYSGIARVRLHQNRYRLTLWCEHPSHWHPWPDATYVIDRPAEWLRQISRYAGPVFMVLRRAIPLVGTLAGVALSPEQLEHANKELELMRTLIENVSDAIPAEADRPATRGEIVPASGAELRGVRQLLHEVDHYRRFGGLHRVQATSGDYLWVCAEHFRDYEPGLPKLTA